jgi:hypothetical protein
VFVIKPEKIRKSPLYVRLIDLNLEREEIVEFVRAGRREAAVKQ